MSTNLVTFLTNRFPRLIGLPTSTIFVSGTSGITAILKYRSVNPTEVLKRIHKRVLIDKIGTYCSFVYERDTKTVIFYLSLLAIAMWALCIMTKRETIFIDVRGDSVTTVQRTEPNRHVFTLQKTEIKEHIFTVQTNKDERELNGLWIRRSTDTLLMQERQLAIVFYITIKTRSNNPFRKCYGKTADML